MKLDRETRRSLAQFLNGLAVASLSALVMAPAASGSSRMIMGMAAVVVAVVCVVGALKLASGRDRR